MNVFTLMVGKGGQMPPEDLLSHHTSVSALSWCSTNPMQFRLAWTLLMKSCLWQGFWRSGRSSHTSCTCRTTGAPGSKASSSSSPLACSSQLCQWLPSSSSSLLPSHRSKVILFLLFLVYTPHIIAKVMFWISMLLFFFLLHSSHRPTEPLSLLRVELSVSQMVLPLGLVLV